MQITERKPKISEKLLKITGGLSKNYEYHSEIYLLITEMRSRYDVYACPPSEFTLETNSYPYHVLVGISFRPSQVTHLLKSQGLREGLLEHW